MLVHISHRIDDKHNIFKLIDIQLDLWREALRQKAPQIKDLFGEIWEEYKKGVDDTPKSEKVISMATDILCELKILELNSATKESLDKQNNLGKHHSYWRQPSRQGPDA